MKPRLLIVLLALFLATLSCVSGQPRAIPTLPSSPVDLDRTVYGFFPSPPEPSLQSIMDTYKALGEHGDAVLLQQSVPWTEFAKGSDIPSQAITDIHNQYILAHQNGLEVIFVVDPLNGLNRREFYNLPAGWEPSFGNPDVRAAITNYTMRIVREFHPPYLGLASEINTYADTHPEDFSNYLSLYDMVYTTVKAEAPQTRIFVTFQWEELNNLMPPVAGGRAPYQVNWDQVEVFEPKLDIWAISSYPFVIFQEGADIPANYYTPLLARTSKPLAVAEGGFSSKPVGAFSGSPQDQVDYLNTIHAQIGERLSFWIYLLLNDFNPDAYARVMKQNHQEADIGTLGMFAFVGLTQTDRTPKPALAVWDSFRNPP